MASFLSFGSLDRPGDDHRAAHTPYRGSGALRSDNNDVRQWLPAGFEETRQYDWFLKQFGSDEMVVASWPGASLTDPRLDRLAAALKHTSSYFRPNLPNSIRPPANRSSFAKYSPVEPRWSS